MDSEINRNNTENAEVSENDEPEEDPQERYHYFSETTIVYINSASKKHFVEPVLLFLFFAFTLYETVLPEKIEKQFCTAVLNIPGEVCLNTTKENLSKLQVFATRFQMLRSLIEIVVPGIISFFLGPWSDTYGRRPLMLSAATGYLITYGLWTLGTGLPSLHPQYFLLFSIPLALSGGASVMILSTFCYVCDITTVETRAARLGRLQAALFVGSFIGTELCSKILEFGYTAVFATATVSVCLTLAFILFLVDESIEPSPIELNSVNRNPFSWQHVRGLYDSCYLYQTPKIRLTVALLLWILSLSLTNLFGESNILYFFLQNVLGWEMKQYTTLSAYIILINAIGAAGGTWLFCSVFKWNDLLVLSFAAFLRIISSLIMLFGYHVWHIYLAKAISCTVGISGSLIRSFLSQVIPTDDLGKVFSLLASMESFTPLIASLTYSSVYNATLATYPAAVFLLSAFILLFMLLLLVILVNMYTPNSSSPKSEEITSNVTSINSD